MNEECTAHVRALLQGWLEAHGKDGHPKPRRWEFNRFEVSLDVQGDAIILEDVLDSSEAGRVKVSLAEFAAALASRAPGDPRRARSGDG